MQLPSVDRQTGLRPAGADLASGNGSRVIPVQPVNPSSHAYAPGVVNKISDSAMPAKPGAVYTSVSDPAVKGSEAANGSKDWTIKRPEPEPVQIPAPEPISKMLLEFLQSIWRASGGVVQISQAQIQSAQQVNRNNPNANPGLLAKEELTYSPSKIKKNDKL